MGNLFYEELEKDYELGPVKEKFFKDLEAIWNNSKWPEDIEDQLCDLLLDNRELFKYNEGKVTYIG